jgi:hypothetical protein
MQWPLWGLCNSSTTSSSSSDPNAASSSSRSSSGVCACRARTCHLCTAPPPVTLQQLRLLLEVVCLTCTDTTPHALQAPLLLALLLQRASPAVRAAFLNAADGDRLLIALQQTVTHMGGSDLDGAPSWSCGNHDGALSMLALSDKAWLLPTSARAAHTLAWCFCTLNAPAPAAAATGAKATPRAAPATAALGKAGRHAAARLTPSAVAQGSLLVHRNDWASE